MSWRRDQVFAPYRVEFWQEAIPGQAATLSAGEVPVGFESWNLGLNVRTSLYWSKQAMAEAPGPLASAVQTHWLIASEMAYSLHSLSRLIPHSVKRPLETRIWYQYPGQASSNPSVAGTGTQPSKIARVLPNGTTQLTQMNYNAHGMLTSTIDPVGRETTSVYALNGIDVEQVRQAKPGGSDVLATYSGYNAQHFPATITDASGHATTITYTATGQPLTVTNAKNETTTYAYDGVTMLTADGDRCDHRHDDDLHVRRRLARRDNHRCGRLVVTMQYDPLNRVTRSTDPDGTFDESVYGRLDLFAEVDRLGRVTRHFYDKVGRRTATRDPLGRVIRQEWCGCGSLNALSDGNGNRTSWERDTEHSSQWLFPSSFARVPEAHQP
jgi:YD repeat-containing protein